MTAKWDLKYQSANDAGKAAQVLTENEHLLPATTVKALDLACGLGANALLLAERGFDVAAWDSSTIAIEKLNQFAKLQNLRVIAEQYDVSLNPPKANSYDVIVVSYFLDRTICSDLVKALKPGGLLFYQTYCQQKVVEIGPKNPHFLLAENELLTLFSALKIRFYREDALVGDHQKGCRNQAMLVAQKAS